MSTAWDWAGLGEAVAASRQSLNLTQAALAERAGVALRSVVNLESGKARTRMPATVGRIEKALTWAPGDARLVLLGADARPRATVIVGSPRKSNLAYRDVEALQDAVDFTDVRVPAKRLRNLLAELALLRERLALYEPLPVVEEPDNDCPF